MKMEFGEKKKKRNYNQMLELNKNHLNVDAKNIIEPKIKNLTLHKLNYYNNITKELEINNINYKYKKQLNIIWMYLIMLLIFSVYQQVLLLTYVYL